MSSCLTYQEWKLEGERRFGIDMMIWKFVCPSCGHIASVTDWKNAGAPESTVAFSCIGRWTEDPSYSALAAFRSSGGPCNYAGGGLFILNPVEIDFGNGKKSRFFAFAEE